MFDLEKAIVEWRNQMLATGIKSPVPLDELESHLRDEIARQIERGLDEQRAFEVSCARIGCAADLKREFAKTNQTKGVNMTRIIATITGLFAMAVGLGMILPALARHYQRPDLQPGVVSWPLVLGSIIVIVGAVAAYYCIRTRREARGRVVITAALLLFGAPFFGVPITLLFQTNQMPRAGWLVWAVAVAVSVAFFGSCFVLNWRGAAPSARQA
jgi:hypothetical protein